MKSTKKANNAAFIDSQNLNLGVQAMGWKMDWRKLRVFLEKEFQVTKAYMFIGYMAENESMYEQLHEAGYLIVLKPTLDIKTNERSTEVEADKNSGEKEEAKHQVKGNIDADLVLYAMKELPNYDQAVIISGDGDFYGLIEYLIAQHKLRRVLTPNWKYSSLLKPFENYIERLDFHRRELSYQHRGSHRPT